MASFGRRFFRDKTAGFIFNAATSPIMKKRGAWCLLVGILLAVLGGAGYFAYRVVNVIERAHRSLQAEFLTHDLLDNYIDKNSRWPASWDDLRKHALPDHPEWPDDWPDIEDYVRIDFNLTLAEVVAQEEEKFTAVVPIGTHYEGFREGFRHHLARHKYRKEAKNDHAK